MGAVVLLVLIGYLMLSLFIVAWVGDHAKKTGKPVWKWAGGAALVMYLIPFWDWIPTVLIHRYYCATEAGFWVYKTPEQWMKENPGVMDTLLRDKNMSQVKTQWGMATSLNQRFLYFRKFEGPLNFNRWRMTIEIRDQNTGELLVRSVDQSTSQERPRAGMGGWKFWLDTAGCTTVGHRDIGVLDQITAQFEEAK